MSSELEKMNRSGLLALYKKNKKKIRENCKEVEKLQAQLNPSE